MLNLVLLIRLHINLRAFMFIRPEMLKSQPLRFTCDLHKELIAYLLKLLNQDGLILFALVSVVIQ